MSFKKELKRQIKLAIIAAVGFIIAFAWQKTIFDASQNLLARTINLAPTHALSEAATAVFLSIIGVAIIFINSRLLRD